MTYDAATGDVLLFGGAAKNGKGYLSDTWNWDGSTWTNAGVASPPARWGASMAYDAATGDVVLFGGIKKNDSLLSDTWDWTGLQWTQVDDSGQPGCSACTGAPPRRVSASMAYDAATGDVVLFGGFSDTDNSLSDTWTWNGSTWTQVDDSGQVGCTMCTGSPPPRYGASMAYDAALGAIVLFGGTTDGLTTLSDTWEWNGSWTQVDDSGQVGCTMCTGSPPSRFGASAAYDTQTGVVVLFGGIDSSLNIVGDTWEWNGSWTQVDDLEQPGCTTSCPGSPLGLWESSMAYDDDTGSVVLFGGYSSAASIVGDTWNGP